MISFVQCLFLPRGQVLKLGRTVSGVGDSLRIRDTKVRSKNLKRLKEIFKFIISGRLSSRLKIVA